MEKIKDYIQTPSQALEAMLEGALTADLRDDFVIDTAHFSRRSKVEGKDKICGCLATCAVQEITGVNLTLDNFIEPRLFTSSALLMTRAKIYNVFPTDLHRFETSMEVLRGGGISYIHTYFNLPIPEIKVPFIILGTCSWYKQIPEIRLLIHELKQHEKSNKNRSTQGIS